MAAAFQRAVARLQRAGVRLVSIDIVAMLSSLNSAARTVMFYEGARFHRERFEQYGDRLADLATLVREGLQITEAMYGQAKQEITDSQIRCRELFARAPIILVPAATGPAPLGLGFTGDTSMNAPWTALGTPAISIPMVVAGGLPLGLQLTAGRGQEALVLRSAVRLYELVNGNA
jgi:Asp-tRNA(Asn)/Glu-tRNA(Gln) amidotransferase A subunit family amidase